MKIKNSEELAVMPLRKDALEIIEAGLEAIDTTKIMRENIRVDKGNLFIRDKKIDLTGIRRIFVVGIGKCALEAGESIENTLGDLLTGGIVLDVQGRKLKKIKSLVGSHPFVSEINIDVTKEIIDLLKDMTESDLVIFIISGGGSALLCQPDNFTCQDETAIVKCLFDSGVPIKEMNTVRKHLSLARGGYLAQYAYPAKVISLIFSDVLGNELQFVSSGPTMMDTTTVFDAEEVLNRYKIWKKCLVAPVTLIETPKDEKYFKNVENIMIVSNAVALDAMKKSAERLGYAAMIMTNTFSGEAKEIGPDILKELSRRENKSVLLYGGESTVTIIKKEGKGGRNQELVLSALPHIKDGQVIVSFDTDGKDNTDFAGAFGDMHTVEKAKKLRIHPEKYLASSENNSYWFFEQTGDYLMTGNTGSNVSDIIIAMTDGQKS